MTVHKRASHRILFIMLSYLNDRYQSWRALTKFVAYFFSLGLLFKTLLSGWRRDSSDEYEWWQRLILNTTFIIIGLAIRLVVISIGLVVMLLTLVLLPILLIIPIRLSYERLVKIGSIGKSWAYGASPTLHRYGIALYKGHDTKLYGREGVIALIVRALSREERDNVLLVGEPGIGKETLLAQFAKNVYRGLVPLKLKNREVIEIPVADIPIDQLKKMFNEARQAGNIIAVIHEPEKYQGILDELVPLLQAAELQVIAITSFEGYVGFWKNRTDILRYFERIDIPPLSSDMTLEFLNDYAHQRYPSIHFEENVFKEIIRRTDDLIQTKTQPEKSIDLLEELVVGTTVVTVADVDRILSQKTGVPLGALEHNEKQVLLTLEETLKTEIVGQEEAVRAIASALRRARTGVASKRKPIGSLLFLGPTGSGKTYTAQMLARHYFGGDGTMVRFDMSEFALSTSELAFINRITLSIEENPFCLLFLDELEKADRTIWNTLLQVLDEGRLTTSIGQTVSFKNAIIIATSNAGTALIESHLETTKNTLMQFLIEERIFSPEFLNRFDDIILFHPLSVEDAYAVTHLLLHDLNERLLNEHNVMVEITDQLVQDLVAKGFDQKNGARALRRAIQDSVENSVADAILRGQAISGTCLILN